MPKAHRTFLTLPRFFALIVGGLAALSALVLVLAVRTASEAVVRTGEAARVARASQVANAVETELGVAERAVEDFETALGARLVDDHDPQSLHRYLAAELIALRNLTDLTLTTGALLHYDDDGQAVLAPEGRRQISLYRDSVGATRDRLLDDVAPGSATDPTLHDTFRAAANRDARGQALWSDLAYSELDSALPEPQRRKTMTVQKAIFVTGGDAPSGRFVGVLRAGIVSDTLDRIGPARPAHRVGEDGLSPSEPAAGGFGNPMGFPITVDPHRFFICDVSGRLVTRLAPGDRYGTVDADGKPDPDGDLRVLPEAVPPAVAAALGIARGGGTGGKRMVVGGAPYFLTLAPLAEGRAQQWLAGVVVPESYYVGPLARTRDRLLIVLGLVVAASAIAGLVGARTVGRGVRALVRSTEAMRLFSFEATPAGSASPFGEIRSALESVERAKTALRAMVKYVPIDLVRRLYESGRDPVLGADLTQVSLMFTDIADFTTHAEKLPPRLLAEALGRYLEAATRAVESTGGTVDKYIGDALMVLWNAPTPVARHAEAACRGAIACAAATRALGTSAPWQAAGLPPWRTRFGLHTDHVLVGNFGAPERLSYTAMGDGVNLAARLEGLNKIYGTTILVSEDVAQAAGDAFVFRQVDRVAVKGKARAVAVLELLGLAGDSIAEAQRPVVAAYEAALAAALDRRFEQASRQLATLRAAFPSDGPAAVLAERCRVWLADPPPASWDGTWAATTK